MNEQHMENPCKIICFGDSITQAWAPLFAVRMAERHPDSSIETINMGVVSDTTVQGLKRLDRVISESPQVVLMAFGMNDWRKGIDLHRFKENLSRMAKQLLRNDIRLLLLTITPDNNLETGISGAIPLYNREIENVANRNGCRVVDLFSAFREKINPISEALYDEIHPNSLGEQVIVDELMDIVPLSQTVIVWTYNGEYCFCNYNCPYCYVTSEVNTGHAYDGQISRWHDGFRRRFGSSPLVFYLAFGEPMAGKGFYEILDMIASEPTWQAHITTNLSMPLERFVKTRIVREGRMQVNASFHPSQTDGDDFIKKLTFLRAHGVEPSVIYVMYPPQMKKFKDFFAICDALGFFVHVRRFRGDWRGNVYPQSYTEEERRFVARFCDRLTVRYMLNDFEDHSAKTASQLSYAGVNYMMVDDRGDVWRSPDFKGDKPMGNLFEENFKPLYRPAAYGGSFLGSVNIVASMRETGIYQLEGNHTWCFAKNGGVYRDAKGRIHYPLMVSDFDDSSLRRQLNWPFIDNNRGGIR